VKKGLDGEILFPFDLFHRKDNGQFLPAFRADGIGEISDFFSQHIAEEK